MTILERAAYLKGLMDGSELTFGDKEKKVVDAVMELLSDMAEQITEMDEGIGDLYDGLETVYDSLDAIEEDLDYLFDGEEGCDCDSEDGEEQLYDVECPKCHEVTCIDEDTLLLGDINCPNCGEKLEFDFSCDCEECREDEDNQEQKGE